jgi:nifR3 family TIM-barrel protein
MVRLTKAVIRSTTIPVTVKTRLGWDFDSINIVEVAERLQDIGVQALSIHGRTRSQLYKGEADWSYIAKVKNNPRMHIPIFGNGDIDSPEKAILYKNRYGVDGVMIGRAAIGYPWIFREIKHYINTGSLLPLPTFLERLDACRTHFERSVAWKGEKVGVIEMRRHYGSYFKGIADFKEMRNRLVTANTQEEVRLTLLELEQRFSEVAYP